MCSAGWLEYINKTHAANKPRQAPYAVKDQVVVDQVHIPCSYNSIIFIILIVITICIFVLIFIICVDSSSTWKFWTGHWRSALTQPLQSWRIRTSLHYLTWNPPPLPALPTPRAPPPPSSPQRGHQADGAMDDLKQCLLHQMPIRLPRWRLICNKNKHQSNAQCK